MPFLINFNNSNNAFIRYSVSAIFKSITLPWRTAFVAKLSINLPLSFPPTISARQTATRHAILSNFLKNSG